MLRDPAVELGMKLVGMLVAALIIGLLAVMMLRSYNLGGEETAAPPATPPGERFMKRCQETAPPRIPRPADYCRCLWGKGVTTLVGTLASDKGRRATEACRAAQSP